MTPDPKVRRAWSVLTIKTVDAEQRVITGIATSASMDSYGDVVEPDGAEYTLPIPLLWQHDSRQPIGEVFAAKQTADGIEIKARIAKADMAGKLKDRLDEAWQSVTLGLVRGLSIGFRSLEESYDKESGGFRFIRWAWHELSCVTIPANADANIQTIRSMDSRAASGHRSPSQASGVSGVPVVSTRIPNMKKSYADMVADCMASRRQKTDRLDALLTKSGEAGVTLDAAEAEEHDTLSQEITALDAQIVRYKAAEQREKDAAVEVRGTTREEGLQARKGTTITVERKLPPGIAFSRYAMCMGLARGNPFEAQELARKNYPDDPGIVRLIEKTAVGAAAVVTSHWADDLVPYNIMDDFINYLRPRTIIGKFGATTGNGVPVPSLRRVPFNVRVSGFSAGTTGKWVGEGLPTLVSKATSFNTTLTWAKIGALAVLTKEEMRFSNPSAEAKVRDDIAAAIIAKQDSDFVNPTVAAVSNVSPASITWGNAPIPITGTTAAAMRTDLSSMLKKFADAYLDPSDIVLIMSTAQAMNAALMITSLGTPVWPEMSMAGGRLGGFPVIASEQVASTGSPLLSIIVAVKAGDVYLADDGVVTVDASDQASVEMVDTSSQSGVSGTGASLVSFWQSGLVGLKATREITWKLRRSLAAQYLENTGYLA